MGDVKGLSRKERSARAIDSAVVGDEELPPELSPWWHEGTTTRDGRRAVEVFVANVAAMETRAASLDRGRGLGGTDRTRGRPALTTDLLCSALLARA